MIRLPGLFVLVAGLAIAAASPAHAFVGYGVDAGTPMYEALQDGYSPPLDGRDWHRAPPGRRIPPR